MSNHRRVGSWRVRYYGPDGRKRGRTFQSKSDAERWLADQAQLSFRVTGPTLRAAGCAFVYARRGSISGLT